MTQALTDPEPQAVETPDGEVAAILARRVTQSKLGLTFAPETTFDEWQAAHGFFSGLKEHLNWWVGDSINFAAKSAFGEKYTQAIHITGKEYSTLTTIAAVCERITLDRRRALLPFSYHVEVAYLPYQEADFILDQAERQNWNRDDIREAVQKKTGITPKKRKSSGTAAKVAASGKTPELVEAPEVAPATKLGILWNGHPLATSERLIYQADEKLEPAEADRAAHHHGFAHAEALVNWLEQNGFIRKEGEPQCAPTPNTKSSSETPTPIQSAAPAASVSAGSGPSLSDPTTGPIHPENDTFESIRAFVYDADVQFEDLQSALLNLAGKHQALRNESCLISIAPSAKPRSPAPWPVGFVKDPSFYDGNCVPTWDYRRVMVVNGVLATDAGEIPDPDRCARGHGFNTPLELIKWINDPAPASLVPASATPEPPVPPETLKAITPLSEPVATHDKTSLELAEEHILAFNAAAEKVDWPAVGKIELARKKWLGRLLAPADNAIDAIQGTPPTPRK